MRCRILAALFVVAFAPSAHALPSLLVMLPLQGSSPQIRAPHANAAALLASARARSATVRRLLGEIATTDVIVYVELARDPRVPRARTALISTEATRRFLLVTLNPAFSQPMLISLFGHELQHVLEIGHARDVFDQDSLRRLYQRIGSDVSARDRFETTEADLTGRQVFREAADSFRHHTEAVTVSTGKSNPILADRQE